MIHLQKKLLKTFLDPFFIVGKLKDKGALLVEDDEFDKIQPLIETELEKSSS